MRTYDDPDSEDFNPEAVERDRALGVVAAEAFRQQSFPAFTDLAHTGVGGYEPHLIYRNGDAFLIVETETCDADEEEMGVWGRELSDGRVVERGSREYLLAGIHDLAQRTEAGKDLAAAIHFALSANRVRYALVTTVVTGAPGEQEAKSIEFVEYTL
jgi:hypothetical protein